MNDFDPAKLESMQVDEITITVAREQADAFAFCLSVGLDAAPDHAYPQEVYDDLFDLADRLGNFGRTGVDNPEAYYCIACGQLDEPELHDPEKCVRAYSAASLPTPVEPEEETRA